MGKCASLEDTQLTSKFHELRPAHGCRVVRLTISNENNNIIPRNTRVVVQCLSSSGDAGAPGGSEWNGDHEPVWDEDTISRPPPFPAHPAPGTRTAKYCATSRNVASGGTGTETEEAVKPRNLTRSMVSPGQ